MGDKVRSEELASLNLAEMFTNAKLKYIMKLLAKPLKKLTKINILDEYNWRIANDTSSESIWTKWLKHLEIAYRIINNAIHHIPQEGRVIVVANHPFGMIDGVILADILNSRRRDYQLMANKILTPINGFTNYIIGVDPYNHKDGLKANIPQIRKSLKWLHHNGALAMFPSGDVSHYDKKTQFTYDPPWNETVGKIILKSQASVVPIFFHGRNSDIFYQLRQLQERFASFMLARELLKMRRSCVSVSIGEPVSAATLQGLATPTKVMEHLRKVTYRFNREHT